MENNWVEYAPIIILVLGFLWQNGVFVKPEQLEKTRRETIEYLEQKFQNKYVEINAYKEFQNHVYSKLDEICERLDEVLMRRRKED